MVRGQQQLGSLLLAHVTLIPWCVHGHFNFCHTRVSLCISSSNAQQAETIGNTQQQPLYIHKEPVTVHTVENRIVKTHFTLARELQPLLLLKPPPARRL